MANMELSLVMPAYNEAAGIENSLREANTALGTFAARFEIVVVDDGSRDDTADRVTRLIAECPQVRLIRHGQNRGYGAALRSGFTAARCERIAFTDADAQFHLEDLGRLVELTDQYDVAVGYRMQRQDPWRRRFLSWGYNRIVSALLGTGVRDCDCALKVFRREALMCLLPEASNFFVNTEMLSRAKAQGISVVELGVRHRARRFGSSTVSLWEVPRTLRTLIPYWWAGTVPGR